MNAGTIERKALTPDLSIAFSFLDALEPSTPPGIANAARFTFQTFDDNTERKNPKLACILHGTLDQHAERLIRLNDLGAGVFVTVNKTDLRGRKTENVIGLRALFVDGDDVPRPTKWHVQPDLFCWRSEKRWHAYWKLQTSTPLEVFTPAQKKLAAGYGTDKGIHDLPRVMRIPGFIHRKAEPVMLRFENWSAHAHR